MFKSLSEDVSAGSCPYCNSYSFVYEYEDKKMFLCHMCQRHIQYKKVKWNVNNDSTGVGNDGVSQRVSINYNSVLRNCQKLSDLPSDHDCVRYARHRQIPDSTWSELFYCGDFREVATPAGIQVQRSSRLILPFYNEDGELFGLQGRSLDGSEPRYVTIMYKDNEEKIFGKNKVDMTKPFYCVEGPIDSLFLKNCVAMAGSDGLPNKYKTSAVMCLDNEPRNNQIVAKLEKHINDGFKVVIWPDNIQQKDINDMIQKGVDVQHVVEHNTVAGLAAKIKFNSWKRV